jgi:hypothetical protein
MLQENKTKLPDLEDFFPALGEIKRWFKIKIRISTKCSA